MIGRGFSAALLALSALSCASQSPPLGGIQWTDMVIDESANGTTVQLRQGQRLVAVLKGNPTTGFGWEIVQGGEPALLPKGKPEFSSESTRVGAAGSYRYRFLAVQPGTATLKMVYRRGFEVGVPPAQSFQVTVVVGRVY